MSVKLAFRQDALSDIEWRTVLSHARWIFYLRYLDEPGLRVSYEDFRLGLISSGGELVAEYPESNYASNPVFLDSQSLLTYYNANSGRIDPLREQIFIEREYNAMGEGLKMFNFAIIRAINPSITTWEQAKQWTLAQIQDIKTNVKDFKK